MNFCFCCFNQLWCIWLPLSSWGLWLKMYLHSIQPYYVYNTLLNVRALPWNFITTMKVLALYSYIWLHRNISKEQSVIIYLIDRLKSNGTIHSCLLYRREKKISYIAFVVFCSLQHKSIVRNRFSSIEWKWTVDNPDGRTEKNRLKIPLAGILWCQWNYSSYFSFIFPFIVFPIKCCPINKANYSPFKNKYTRLICNFH